MPSPALEPSIASLHGPTAAATSREHGGQRAAALAASGARIVVAACIAAAAGLAAGLLPHARRPGATSRDGADLA